MNKIDTIEKKQELEYKYAKEALNWYGWGSPIGLGFLLVSIGLFMWLLHLANIIR